MALVRPNVSYCEPSAPNRIMGHASTSPDCIQPSDANAAMPTGSMLRNDCAMLGTGPAANRPIMNTGTVESRKSPPASAKSASAPKRPRIQPPSAGQATATTDPNAWRRARSRPRDPAAPVTADAACTTGQYSASAKDVVNTQAPSQARFELTCSNGM